MQIIILLVLAMIVIFLGMMFEESMVLRCLIGSLGMCMLVLICILTFGLGKELGPDIQYIPAEYVAENETSTYFGTEDGNIFYTDRIPFINRNIPYLLGMDTQGTSDVTDDIILTVWALYE